MLDRLRRTPRQSERTCGLDQVSGLLECTLVAQPAPPRRVRLSIEIPLVWVRVPFNVDEWIAQDRGCVRVSSARSVRSALGYAIALNNVVTMEQLYLDFVCTWPGDPPPEPPPPPPSSAELVEREHAGR